MQSPVGNQVWCPGPSLWSLIAEHVSVSELPKIREALGHSIIDMYTEVHAEAEMWHQMWQCNFSSSRPGSQQGSPLADPPAVKELLRAEVKMLLQTLTERASRGGRDGEELLFRYKPETVDYALGHLDSCYTNCNNLENSNSRSVPSSPCSVQSNAEDEIEAMRDKMNITDIDQVVDRLKSVLVEECEALNRLVKQLKTNIKQKCRRHDEFNQPEPTLAELRELRGSLQMDLEIYPSSLAASPSASCAPPLRELKNKFRPSVGQTVSDETLKALSSTPVLKPHPPRLCHNRPRPPFSAPSSKTPAKLINSSSLSRTHGQHRSLSASTGPKKTQTHSTCKRIPTSGHENSHFTAPLPGPGSDQIMVKTVRDSSLSTEHDSAGLHSRTPTSSPRFQRQTPSNSATHNTLRSTPRRIHSPSRNCDLSAQTERINSPAWSSRNINSIPSSPHRDAGSHSSRSSHYVSTIGKSKTQNATQSSKCAGSLVSATANERRSTLVMSETGSSPAQTSRKSKNSPLVNHQHSLVATRPLPASVQINGQFFTSPKTPLEGTTSQLKSVQDEQTKLELINTFYQPVPPARVST